MSTMSLSDCIHFCKQNCWSDSAVATILAAESAARQRHCEYIGTELLLLALVTENNSASALLIGHDETAITKIAAEIEKLVLVYRFTRRRKSPSLGELCLTPRSVNAIKAASDLPVATVRCEHVLIGLLLDSETVAYHLLLGIGFTYDRLLAIANGINDCDEGS